MLLQLSKRLSGKWSRRLLHLLSGVAALVMLAALIAPAGMAVATNAVQTDFPEAQLRQYLDGAARQIGLPTLTVAVSYQGEAIFDYAYGDDVSTDTLSYIGSISKSFTALAIMQLVEGGYVYLDAPVSRYLSEFRVSDGITVRKLLNQKSGMTDLEYIPSLPAGASFDDLIEDMNSILPRYAPGETFAYFNQNYSLLGAIVEKASGLSYETYLEDNILRPLGLQRTFLRGEVDVTGHLTAFAFSVAKHEPFIRYDMPGGYITSTVTDMVTYLDLLAARDERLGLSPEGVDLMMHADPYGMGWMAGTVAGRPAVFHGGSLPGYVANTIMLTEDGYNIALLTNKNHLFYSLFFYPDLSSGIVSIIVGQQVPSRYHLAWVLRMLLLAVLLNAVLSARTVLRLLQDAKPEPRLRRLKRVGVNLAIPVVLVLLIPTVATFILGRGMTWQLAFFMMPDMLVWMTLGLLSHIVTALSHIYLLMRVD